MATLTIADLDNGKRDLETVEAVANSRAATATTRFGQETTTLYESIRRINATGDEILSNLGFRVPVPYASGLEITDLRFTVTGPDGKVYAPLSAPFTAGAWDSTQWYVLQNDLNDHKLLVFDALESAEAAAATLPDGQAVEAPNADDRFSVFKVMSGQLVFQRFKSEVLNIKDYPFFAKGDGVTDDTAAIQACLNAWQLSGYPIYIPPGKYKITSPLTAVGAEGRSFVMFGDFCDTTELLLNTGGDGLSIKITGSWWGELSGVKGAGARFSNIRFSTNNLGTGVGLKITGDSVEGRSRVPIVMEYLQFGSNAGIDKSWETMTDLLDAGLLIAHGCKWVASKSAQTVCLSLRGTDQASSPVHYKVTSCEFTYGGRQIQLGNFVEGVYITGCSLVGSDYGVYWAPSQGESGLHVANSHMSSRVACIYLNNVFDFNITGNLFFRSGGNSDHYTIHLQNVGSFTITGNVFKGNSINGGSSVYGVYVQSSVNYEKRGGLISANSFHDFPDMAIWLAAASYYVSVNSNSYRGCVLGYVLNQQANSNTVEYPSTSGSVVKTLTGGAISEKVSVPIRSGTFRAKPPGGFINGIGNNSLLIGTYDYDDAASTATNAVFTVRRFDNAVLTAGNVRLAYTLFQ